MKALPSTSMNNTVSLLPQPSTSSAVAAIKDSNGLNRKRGRPKEDVGPEKIEGMIEKPKVAKKEKKEEFEMFLDSSQTSFNDSTDSK